MPREPKSEEYLNSEKYEIRDWHRDRRDSLRPLITRVNAIRRANPALHADWTLRFHPTDNPEIICYSKTAGELDNVVLVVVSLDPFYRQSGFVELDLDAIGIGASEAFDVQDLLTDARYVWRGPRNYVELRPQEMPAHVFRVTPRSPHDATVVAASTGAARAP